MGSDMIESLLKAANSSSEGDTSVNSSMRSFSGENDAVTFFEETKARLSRIDEWNNNSSATSYDLFDENGDLDNSGPISAGKFIRLSLYGSGKYDWVRVVSVRDERREFVIKVK